MGRKKPSSVLIRQCSLCKKKLKGTQRDYERHIKTCNQKLIVLKNDKKIYGIHRENLWSKMFKCMHCKEEIYTTKLREHAFRHVRAVHADLIPPDAIKINIKKETHEKKAALAVVPKNSCKGSAELSSDFNMVIADTNTVSPSGEDDFAVNEMDNLKGNFLQTNEIIFLNL